MLETVVPGPSSDRRLTTHFSCSSIGIRIDTLYREIRGLCFLFGTEDETNTDRGVTGVRCHILDKEPGAPFHRDDT